MSDDIKQEVYFKMYTSCSVCGGKGSFDYVTKVCPVCKGRGKNEKFLTIEELKKLLEVIKL